MTLMELLVGLSILALMLSLALPALGPWLTRSRRAEGEAQFWREVEAAQMTVSEFTIAAIDPEDTLRATTNGVRFRALVPRLSDAPIDAELAIASAKPDILLLRTPALQEKETAILFGGPPLRLRPLGESRGAQRRLIVEAQLRQGWTPILAAPFAANAPLVCTFDFISRTCR